MDLNERLKELRKMKGVTQQEMSKELLISVQSINKWENGKCLPDAINLLNLAVYFDVSLDFLMNHEVHDKKRSNVSKYSYYNLLNPWYKQ